MLTKQKLITLGLQHVLAMYAGAAAVPLIIGGALHLNAAQMAYLIAADMFTCGLATLLQVIGTRHIGIRLPVVLGCTFTAVGPVIAIASSSNLATVFGATMIAGLLLLLLAPVYGKLLRFFPTVVVGSVVTVIGLSLIPVAMNNAAGGLGSPDFGSGKNLLLAFLTLALILILNRYFKGFMRAISVLIGLILGTIAGYAFGMVHFAPVLQASWIRMIQPFYFGRPEFHLGAVLTMLIVCIIGMVEATGVYFALGEITNQDVTANDVVKGLRAEGIAIVLGAILNTFPYTTFSQNVGLVSLTGVKKRSVIVVAGITLVILGLLPKLAALTTVIPTAVLGGAMIAMFGMVAAYGMHTLATVDFQDNGNLLIVACSIAVGLGSAVAPDIFAHVPATIRMLLQNGIVTGSVTAVVLNLLFHHRVSGMLPQKTTPASELNTLS
jgi:xanthine permease